MNWRRNSNHRISNFEKLDRFRTNLIRAATILTISPYNPDQELSYRNLKLQLECDYSELRPFLAAFLDEDMWWTTQDSQDIFQTLWSAPTLLDFAESPNPFFRDQVGCALEALEYYNVHLHMLREVAR